MPTKANYSRARRCSARLRKRNDNDNNDDELSRPRVMQRSDLLNRPTIQGGEQAAAASFPSSASQIIFAENAPPNVAENAPPNVAENAPLNVAENAPPNAFIHEEETELQSSSTSLKPDLNIDDHPNILSESRIEKMKFSPQSKADLRKHCIAIAKTVRDTAYPDGMNPKHFSILQMFQEDSYWNLICYFWRISNLAPNDSEKKEVMKGGLGYIKALFKQVDVDLNDFRDDLEELYEKTDWSKFVRLMIIYMARSIQEWCVVKDCEIDTTMITLFGGAGMNDGDHACENMWNTLGVIKKKFSVARRAATKYFPQLLQEIAKICRTCCFHHQHDSSCSSCFSELPNECSNDYVLKGNNNLQVDEYSSVAPCLVQESEQFKATQELTDHYCAMTSEQIRQVTFSSITERYNNEAPLAFQDIFRLTESKWNSFTSSQRCRSIKHAEMAAEKTLCRKCFRCGVDCMNIAAKYKSGLHFHHMDPNKKKHNPSEGPRKSLDEQRFENRKTIMLCAGCHCCITYNKKEEQVLIKKFESLGYYIVSETGEIKNKNAHDGLKVHAL